MFTLKYPNEQDTAHDARPHTTNPSHIMRIFSNIAALGWCAFALIVFDTTTYIPPSLGFFAKVRYCLFRPRVFRWFVRFTAYMTIDTGIRCLEDWRLPNKTEAHPISFLVLYILAVLMSTMELIAKWPCFKEIAKEECMNWAKENDPEKYALLCARDAETANQKKN
ncbi:hypothetical protein J3458_016808 [Metarhizium acridum]|uniref:uncharacterized protein n=1 Tax=Metarhizium acridum TaxID=92637 RepID=UPI001C6D22A5|nr:hypothetical protein J3458_016808 [Metarhizium acridum]